MPVPNPIDATKPQESRIESISRAALDEARALPLAEIEKAIQRGSAVRLFKTDAWLEFLVRIKMEPPFLFGVPGNIEGLQPAFVQLHQILLKRLYADCVFDLKLSGFAVGAVRFDEKFVIASEEARASAPMVERRIVEVPQHILPSRLAQGPTVV